MGLFIQVEIDKVRCHTGQSCTECVRLCPVNIFFLQGNGVKIIEDSEDECILCNLCLEACAPDAIRIRKLYEEG